MMNRRMALLGIIFWMMALSGCSSLHLNETLAGSAFPDRQVQQIQRHYTTESDIIQLFGQPYITTSAGNNYQRWTYYYQQQPNRESWLGRNFGKSYQKTLIIVLKNGIVERYRYFHQ
ncbi:outer membrane protein assembly factor BamE [Celerinatantimonas sp. YJH-8]|uniref:outer membrane protein assembly factor BamE domain-containing protein n=1 Tax=Celerinatantimonas sp. YJH-8 TaxID=3228714 RepID=UPI0038C471C7